MNNGQILVGAKDDNTNELSKLQQLVVPVPMKTGILEQNRTPFVEQQ